MRSRKVLDEERTWWIDWVNEWASNIPPCNWYDFHFAHVYVEWDKIMGGVDVSFIILGLGFRWRWNYTVTEQAAELKDRVAEIMAGTAKTRPLSDVLEDIRNER